MKVLPTASITMQLGQSSPHHQSTRFGANRRACRILVPLQGRSLREQDPSYASNWGNLLYSDQEPSEQTMYKQGDELKLSTRPEWGIGTVTRVEHVTREGERDQRIWVRFPNVGMKTILAGAAEVEHLNGTPDNTDAHTFAAREHAHETGWLGEITKRKPEEAMTGLSPDLLDPFTSLRNRLGRVLQLYRFKPQGASLIDWAIAQSGLDDPLSRFNRHELEEFFGRWAWARDEYVRTLVSEARRSGEKIDDLLGDADPGVQLALTNGNGHKA